MLIYVFKRRSLSLSLTDADIIEGDSHSLHILMYYTTVVSRRDFTHKYLEAVLTSFTSTSGLPAGGMDKLKLTVTRKQRTVWSFTLLNQIEWISFFMKSVIFKLLMDPFLWSSHYPVLWIFYHPSGVETFLVSSLLKSLWKLFPPFSSRSRKGTIHKALFGICRRFLSLRPQ